MRKIVIQAGHVNIENNSIESLRNGTGAPGEREYTADMANRVASLARQKGFQVVVTDANANDDPNITGVDWDYCLALHYESDTHNTNGGFMSAPDPSIDLANADSVKIRNALGDAYFTFTGIPEHPEWQNPNTYYYYLWQYMSQITPCGLLEMGVGNRHPSDYDYLHNQRDAIAEAIVRGLCTAFAMPFDNPTDLRKQIHDILYGKGSVYQKLEALKKLIPK